MFQGNPLSPQDHRSSASSAAPEPACAYDRSDQSVALIGRFGPLGPQTATQGCLFLTEPRESYGAASTAFQHVFGSQLSNFALDVLLSSAIICVCVCVFVFKDVPVRMRPKIRAAKADAFFAFPRYHSLFLQSRAGLFVFG